MMRWEYKVVGISASFKSISRVENDMEEECNILGKEGWELVNFVIGGVSYILIFKKPLR